MNQSAFNIGRARTACSLKIQKRMRPVQKDYGETNFVTGMRAYAALAVVLIHVGGAGLSELGRLGQHLAQVGSVGVYVFFVISGFSVATSYANANSYRAYLIRRVLRIAPLYYFWLAAAAGAVGLNFWGQVFDQRLGAYNWAMHLTFLGFLDYRVTNSIIGTEWSIHVEVFWYVLLPLLLRPIMRFRLGVPIAIATSALFYLLTVYVQQLLPMTENNASLLVGWNPLPYLFSFCLGMSAYKLRSKSENPAPRNLVMALVVLAIIVYLVTSSIWVRPFVKSYFFYSVATFAVICLGSQQNFLCKTFLANRVAKFLGLISYGIYLSHYPIKEWLVAKHLIVSGTFSAFAVTIFLAIVISTLTYFVIERPASNWAKRLFVRRDEQEKAI